MAAMVKPIPGQDEEVKGGDGHIFITCPISKLQTRDALRIALFTASRRAFYEYINPMLPILPLKLRSQVFSGCTEASSFVKILRIATIAATAPYLQPEEYSSMGYDERFDIIDRFYTDAQTAVRESTSTLSQLETIQIALLLSFCARRHDGIPVPENRDWFHVALSKLQSLQKETPVQEMTSHFKRIWWTCFLYERLDAFGPASPVESSEFILNSEDVPPLTLRDFEIDSCYVSWVIGKSEGSRMDMIVKDLRLASIYLQKVWLAEQVDIAIQNNQNFTSRCSVSESPVESTLSAIICDQQFWNAYEVQRQFNTWQKETGNNTIMINEHVRECPCFIVHWTSLSLLYYRIVIALYNSALWAYKKHSSKIDTVKHLLGRERTTYFYSCIMEQTQSVLSQHQAAVAHATDPSIWTSLVTIAGAIKSTQQDRHGPGQSSTALAYEAMSHKSRKIVTAFNSHLTQWKSAPHPISNELPELFMLPGSPRFTPAQALQTFENLRELGAIDEHECKFSIDKRSRKIIQPTHISMTAINYVARNSDMLDASHIIHNLEGLVYGSIM